MCYCLSALTDGDCRASSFSSVNNILPKSSMKRLNDKSNDYKNKWVFLKKKSFKMTLIPIQWTAFVIHYFGKNGSSDYQSIYSSLVNECNKYLTYSAKNRRRLMNALHNKFRQICFNICSDFMQELHEFCRELRINWMNVWIIFRAITQLSIDLYINI